LHAVTGGDIVGVAFSGGAILYIAGGFKPNPPAARRVGSNEYDEATATTGVVTRPSDPK